MKIICLFIVAIGLTLILGCSETPSGPSNSEITNFGVGSYWIYDVISYDTNGVVISVVEDSLWITKMQNVSSKMTITYSTGASYIYDTLGLRSASTGAYWYYSNPNKGDTCWEAKAIPIKVDSSTVIGSILRNVFEIGMKTATAAGPFTTTYYQTSVVESSSGMSASLLNEFYNNTVGMIERHDYIRRPNNDILFLKDRRELKRYHIAK